MKMDLQTVGFHATEDLTNYARQKAEGLTKYYDQIVGAEIYLKLEPDGQENKKAEIKLNIPGNDIYAESTNGKFEGAINQSCDKLKAQIRKLKTKMSTY